MNNERTRRKVGGFLDTEEKVLEFFRGLTGKRKEDMAFGRSYGLNNHQIDTLRIVFNKVEFHTALLDENTVVKVCEMYKEGVAINDIKNAVGMSMSTIYYILNKRVERNRHDFWTPIKEKKLVYLKEVQKKKWREIGMKLGRSMNACCEKYKQIRRKREKEAA